MVWSLASPLVLLWLALVRAPSAARLEEVSLMCPTLRNWDAWFGMMTVVEESALRLRLRLRLVLRRRLRLRPVQGSRPVRVRPLDLGLPPESRAVRDLDAPR